MAARSTTDEKTTPAAVEAPRMDFKAWLGMASRPRRSVVLFAANAVQARIDSLMEEREELLAAARDTVSGEQSWGGGATDTVDVSHLDKAIKAAQAEIAASGLTFVVESIDSDDEDALDAGIPIPKDATDDEKKVAHGRRFMARVHKQIIEPEGLTLDDVYALRRGVGEPEFMKLVEACAEVNSAVSASTPTWRGSFGETRN